MKFEIESEPLVQEKIVKARLEIDGAGDLLLKINDIEKIKCLQQC